MHRAAEPLVCAATADVGEIGVDVGVGRIRIGLEIGRRRHDLAGLAVTALRHLFRQPRLLHWMRAVGREALDGDDLCPFDATDRHRAGAHSLSIDVHGASAALGDAAAEFRACQSDLFPQHPEKRSIALDIDLMPGAVDDDVDHDVLPRAFHLNRFTLARLVRDGDGRLRIRRAIRARITRAKGSHEAPRRV